MRDAILALATVIALGAIPARAHAQARIAGTVLDETGSAAGYALVALVEADHPSRDRGHVLTDEAGRYTLAGVRPGRFRLRVARIGFEPHTSDAFEVVGDTLVTRDLVVQTAPVVVDALLITPGSGCHTLDELPDAAPEVASLWAEAVKGIDIKRAFLRSYRRTVDVRMETHQDNRLIRDVHDVDVRTVVLPDSTEAATAPADTAVADQAEGRDRYGERDARSLTLSLPSEQVVTDPEMLSGYCIEEEVSRSGDGALGLHFRPIDAERPGITIEGAVFIEEDDYRLRGLSYHYYLDGGRVGAGEWVYGNVRVPGDVLRLPVRGSLRMQRIPPPMGLMIREFDMRVEYLDYRGFVPLDTTIRR